VVPHDIPLSVPDDLVWHYTDGPGLLSILADQVLWSTASGYLNDSGEAVLGQSMLLDRFTALAEQEHPVFASLRDRLRTAGSAAEDRADWFFILSASTTPDSLAMWRSYGGRGESYALGLDASQSLRILVPDAAVGASLVIRPRPWSAVRYDEAGQRALVEAVYDKLAAELEPVLAMRETNTGSRDEYLVALNQTIEAAAQAILLIKHSGFREEQETRYTHVVLGDGLREQALSGIAAFRHTNYGVTPYLRLTGDSADAVGHLTTRPAQLPLRAVAISPSPNGAAARESIAALLASHHLSDVDIVSSQIPFRA
jgi:hypothetical protein